MASGKSSVGQELARRLRWQFVDLDARIESRERQSIPEIFLTKGEPGFRLAETAALRDLTESLERDTVVALGGGTFTPPQNRELLRNWPSVFLQAPADELWRRCSEDPAERPLRKDKDRQQFSRLYEQRLPFYRQATVVVETAGKDLASICAKIEAALHLDGKGKTGRPGSSSIPSSNSGTGESM
ncbi:MAG: shikimate kinase [Terriglobales bacterium]